MEKEELEKNDNIKKKKNVNGEGSMYFDKKRKYWRVSITLPDGKRKDFCSKSQTKAIAKKNEFMYNHKKELKLCDKTLVECCEKYLDLAYKNNSFKENTYRTHLDTIKRIKKSNLANMAVSLITDEDIIEYTFQANKKGYSKSIIKKDKAMINWGFVYAITKGFIDRSPLESPLLKNYLKDSKEERKVNALTVEEQAKFFVALHEARFIYQPFSDMWLFALLTGLRVGEVCALQFKDIDFENRTIHIKRTISRDVLGAYVIGETTKTKTGNRIIQYSNVVDNLLKDILKYKQENSEFLFSDGFGHFILPSQVANKLRVFNKQYKITDKLSMHVFRHTFATRMIEQNIPPYAIQHLLGHSRVEITINTYMSFFKEQREKFTDAVNNYWEKAIKTN